MRFVIYDDESLEAITVIDLPLTDRDIEGHGRRWRVALPPSLSVSFREEDTSAMLPDDTVDLWFERFVRERRDGRQMAWMCFTRAADLAMLLEPSWLPGQYSAVNKLKDDVERLERFLTLVLR